MGLAPFVTKCSLRGKILVIVDLLEVENYKGDAQNFSCFLLFLYLKSVFLKLWSSQMCVGAKQKMKIKTLTVIHVMKLLGYKIFTVSDFSYSF